MAQMVTRFSGLELSHLLFTGLDEACSLGAVAETLIRTGLATTFAGTGPGIPDDLEEASATRWASQVCAGSRLAAVAA